MHETLCALLIATTTIAAQSSTPSDFVGVWQAELDGQPSTILTLAADDGTLQGTLVLNGISRDGGSPHVAVRETHALLHPVLNGTKLSFALKGVRGSSTTMNFIVELTAHEQAKLHCLNCGDDAPTVEITKQD
jgi:hypothetical protein